MPTQKRVDRRTHSGKSVQPTQRVNESRGGNADTQIYRRKRWRDFRISVLRDEPFCRECAKIGKQIIAKELDHIIPVKKEGEMYDRDNVQPLCSSCHSRKSRSDRS
ncbi:HNH endonuclease signature motif containing protein [Spirosoma sp. KNUC1025]|uniref:HNH endonuclease signature motif containing protein n=1 Tax=Spirosoma sp. KNUC1025 TaxID=2894082 RepID=UPI0038638A0C|nr:HNH endonuclease [Spirosoma sp. KNUC1025]